MSMQQLGIKICEHLQWWWRYYIYSFLILITLYLWFPVLIQNRDTILALLPIILIAILMCFSVKNDKRTLLISIFGVALPVLTFVYELAHSDISKTNTALDTIAAANDLNCRITATALENFFNTQKLVEDGNLPIINYFPQTYIENMSTIYVTYGSDFITTVNQTIQDMLAFNQTHGALMDVYSQAIATGALGNPLLQTNIKSNIDSLKELSDRVATKFCQHEYVQ